MATDSTPAADGRPARGASRGLRLLLWLGITGVVTLLLWLGRDEIDKAHMALTFLMVVLFGSAREGRVVGLVLSFACFLVFNFFLLPPFYTLRLAEGVDWWVLGAFLVTGGVAAELLHRQQRTAELAERRAREIDRLGALGAESLSVARAADAVEAIGRVIRTELPVKEATIRLRVDSVPRRLDPSGRPARGPQREELEEYAMAERRIVAVTRQGTTHVGAGSVSLEDLLTEADALTDVLIPLNVRDRTVGVLRLSDAHGLTFEPAQARFADALAYYAALAAERVRLAAEAERVEALREADRLKDALLASVSHDLRTPLTSIHAIAAELRHEGEERGALIEEEAHRLNRTVGDLLDLSRLRAGALPVEPEINAAEDLIGAALHRLGGVPGASSMQVHLPEDGSLPLGCFDFVHSLRALTNLVENALRHSPEPGTVELEVRTDDTDLVLQVLDRGPGVPPADVHRLFEPFFRSASSAGEQGTGLGLAIASRVAQAQGGSVAYAPRPGGGSIFSLRLPGAEIDSLP